MSSNQGVPARNITPAAPPASGGTTTNNSEAPRNNNRRNNTNSNRINSNIVQLTNPKTYEGAIKEIGAIMGLKHEKLDKKVHFQIFTDKVSNYIYSSVTNGGDLIPLFSDLEDPIDQFNAKRKPSPMTDAQNADPTEVEIRKEEIKLFVARRNKLISLAEKAFSIIWGQCSSQLQSKITSLASYTTKAKAQDTLWLLKELKKVTSGISAKAEPRSTIVGALYGMFRMRQGATEANDNYYERFKDNASTVELAQGELAFCHFNIMAKQDEWPDREEMAAEADRFKAILLLRSADEQRFGGLASRLAEGASLGRNEYPTTIGDMYELMCEHCPDQPSTRTNNNNNNNTNNNRYGTLLTQSNNIIDPNWILLDTCSTDSVFNNSVFLSSIVKCKDDDVLNIVSNGGGSVQYDTIGDFNLLPMPIYYTKNSMANVLSFGQVAALDGVRITMNTSIDNSILVHYNDIILKFEQCKDGLYFIDMSKLDLKTIKNKSVVNHYSSSSSNICLLNTVDYNKSLYSKNKLN